MNNVATFLKPGEMTLNFLLGFFESHQGTIDPTFAPKDTGFAVPQLPDKFVREPVPGAAAAVTIGTPALNHEIGDDPVKF